MSVKKFKFVSPGVFINEIDNSQLPRIADRLGPVVVGRTERGPAMRPVTVESQAEFVEMFGNAIPGGRSGDVWREGNYQSPTYASYAAMAYLRNNSPVTVVRLLGDEHPNRTTDSGEAGWKATKDAYGLFLWDSGSAVDSTLNGVLAAVWYSDAGVIALSGTSHYDEAVNQIATAEGIQSVANPPEFKAVVYEDNAAETPVLTTTFNFDKNSDKFIRRVFNTNPSLLETSTIATTAQRKYFLGQTFEDHLPDVVDMGAKSAIQAEAVLTVLATNPALMRDTAFTLISTDTTSKTYLLHDAPPGGITTGDIKPGTLEIYVVTTGMSDVGAIAGEIATAIADDNGHAGKLTTERASGVLTITQATAGSDGNTTIAAVTGGDAAELHINGVVSETGFLQGKEAYGHTVGMIVKLADGSTKVGGNYRFAKQAATTNWVFSQQIGNNTGSYDAADPVASPGVEKLFKFNALDCGEWESSNLKVSIEDIRYSQNPSENPYGSFTVSVRKRDDNDSKPKFVERFPNCNLNPQSQNYIKRQIGDQALEWNEGERRHQVVGDYPSNSKFIICEVNPDLDQGALDTQLLPFGFIGPSRLSSVLLNAVADASLPALSFIASPGTSLKATHASEIRSGQSALTLKFPEVRLRQNSEQGSLSNRTEAYWGVDTLASGSSKATNRTWADLMYPLPDQVGDTYTEVQWGFSLDDVELRDGSGSWAEGNRAAFPSVAYSMSGSDDTATEGTAGTYKDTLDQGMDRFTMPLHGGYDGLDVKTLDPFAPDIQFGTDPTDKKNYEYYTIRKAIDTCADAEVVECNLMTVPGITNNGINQHIINVAENRADCLAILDLEGGYLPRANRLSSYDTFAEYGGSVDSTLTNLELLGINSSYACAYYPWVQIRDTAMDAVLWVPPSVVALGTLGSSESKSEVWFAPAGYTRGSLTNGSAGMPTIGVRDRLTSEQRDELYQQNVNPIATFPAEGIVIFGQKTMQVTTSALDRINVRRLMIYIKKEVSRIAATTLFEQNVQVTWNRFLGRVNPLLRSVQTRLGLTAFKVILDETTTTPELIDRNIMYAKILLKPAKAIEFIAIDFVITNSGASFED